MRVLLWHGWLLEGSGSNVYTARVAEALSRAGHDVLILCQEPHPERFPFISAWGTANSKGVSVPSTDRAGDGGGSVTLLRPDIESLLPVFVLDEYEAFDRVVRFVDLTDSELNAYLDANTAAFRTAAQWFRPDTVIAGHAVPGAIIARRALGEGRFVAKIHGSDLEYAVKLQDRYLELAREGLEGARAVAGATEDVLRRTVELVAQVAGRTKVIPPGVEVDLFRPRPRGQALEDAAKELEADPATSRGRAEALDGEVRQALLSRDAEMLETLAKTYDQAVPDPEAAGRLRGLASYQGSLVGYFGKLIPQKGVELFIQAMALLPAHTRGLVVGFGSFREWLTALVVALNEGDADALRWLAESSPMKVELPGKTVQQAAGLGTRIAFTGRLDHRYAPHVLAALDVLVVPSSLEEAFGMVAAEGAAAGALPLVARHSGLAEVGTALEQAVGTPELFTFEPGPGSVERIAAGVRALISLPAAERERLRRGVGEFVASHWTWDRTADRLLKASRT